MFYFTCNHLLCSTCVQRAKTFAKHLRKCFNILFYMYPPLKHFCKCFANVLFYMSPRSNSRSVSSRTILATTWQDLISYCLPAVDVQRTSNVVVGAETVVEVDNDIRPRLLRVAAQRDAVAPRHERVGYVSDRVVVTQYTDAWRRCGWPGVRRHRSL